MKIINKYCLLLVPFLVLNLLMTGLVKAEIIDIPVTGAVTDFSKSWPYHGQVFTIRDHIQAHMLTVSVSKVFGAKQFPFRILITEVDTTAGFHPTTVLYESETLSAPVTSGGAITLLQFSVNLENLSLSPGAYAFILDHFVEFDPLNYGYVFVGATSAVDLDQGYYFRWHAPMAIIPAGTREEHFASDNWRLPSDVDLGFRFEFSAVDVMLRDKIAERLGVYVHGSSHTPPTYYDVYDDVMTGDYSADWIQQLYDDGITKGCNAGNTLYCPKQPVDKSQAVKMILRAKHGGSYLPPDTIVAPFVDVPLSHPDVDWVAQAKVEDITFGCGDGSMFCPRELLTEAGYYVLTCETPLSGTYLGNVTTIRNRCDGTQDYPIQPISIVVNPNCSVDISYTEIRPFTGAGVLRGNTFSAYVSRTEDCSAVTGKNDGTGWVTGVINGALITGNTSVGGTCDCQGLPNTKWDITGNYTATLQ